jgi:hypothetical protein
VAVIVLLAFVATAIYAVPLDRFFVMPDELTYSKAALQIWSSPPLVGTGSDWFTSWSQLAQVVYAVPFGLAHDLVDGVRIAHLIAAAAMALTAVPAYLLALEVTGERRAGYLVAALCVCVPWMAMAGTLMTEVFAYPAFTWAAWATVRTCATPSRRHDAYALIAMLVAVFARAQLVFVPLAVVAAVAAVVVRERQPLRAHRLLAAAIGIAILVVALRIVLGGGLSATLGTYSSLKNAHSVSLGIGGRLIAYVGVAIAAVPLIVGIPWIVTTLFRPERPAEFGFSVFATCSIAAVVYQASLELTQPGRLHDRYLIYALPLLFTAMAAALISRRRLVAGTVVVGLLFALLVSRYDFFETGAELPSLSFTLHEPINNLAFSFGDQLGISDLSPGWFLAGLIVAITVLLALLLQRASAQRALLVAGVPVLVFCAVETASAFRQVTDSYYGFGYVEPRPRNWVDRTVPPGADVAALVAQAGNPLATPVTWWDVGFWNESVDKYYVPPTGPQPERWGQSSTHVLALDSKGRPLDRREWWIVSAADPKVRVRGGHLIARAGPLELRQATPDAPLQVIP